MERIPSAPGWFEIPNSQLAASCPEIASIHGVEGCQAVMADWSGGLADLKRNRLVIWGGGHNGYYGNELYALDLNPLKMQRLTEPSSDSDISNLASCPEAYLDGKPNARHTYSGLQYLAGRDLYFAFGAALSPCGNFTNVVWIFDPTASTWVRKNSKGHPNPAQNGSVPLTAYDSTGDAVYAMEGNAGAFWKYDLGADNWAHLADVSACARLNMTSAIDPKRKIYLCVGNNSFNQIRIGGRYATKNLKGTNCSGLVAASGPGFDFDSSTGRFVGWAGGNEVYIYDPEADSCTRESYAGGPGPAQKNGTYGRFRYFPALDVFAIVNDWKENAFTLRLSSDVPRPK